MKNKVFCLFLSLVFMASTSLSVYALERNNSGDYEESHVYTVEHANLERPLPLCGECCPQFASGRVLNHDNAVKFVIENGYITYDDFKNTGLRGNDYFDVAELDSAPRYIAFTRIIIEEHIHIADHVFGVDSFLDSLFENQSFVVMGTVIEEFRDISNDFTLSSSLCRPGQHTNVDILGVSQIIWTHVGHNFRGGWCTARVATYWRCLAPNCFTTGTEITTSLAWCMSC